MKHKSQVHQFGPYEFNPAQQQLRQGKSVQTLPVSLNKLLLLFVSRPGELITRDQIAEALWEQQQETVDTAAGINTAIRRLRTRIGDNNGHGVFIETVVGSGYRFAAQVSVATPTFVEEASAPTPVPTTALTEPPLLGQSPESEKVRPRKRRQWIALSCGSLLFLAAMALAVGYWAKQNTSANTSRIAETSLLGILQPATFDEPEDELTAQAISPSGKLVAASDRHGILLRTLASGAVRRLDGPLGLRIAHIAWLPNDGGLLVTTALRQTTATASASTPGSLQLWKIDLNGASPQPLLSDASFAAVSPNGEHIAFLRHGQTEIWIAALDGSAPRRLTQSSNADVFTWLLWSQRDTLILTDRRSTGIPQIADQDLGALKSVTPDSAQDDFTYESYDARTGTKTASRNGVRFDSAALLSNRLVYPDNQSHDAAELTSVEINPDTGAFLAAPRNWPIETRATALNQLTASSDGQTLS